VILRSSNVNMNPHKKRAKRSGKFHEVSGVSWLKKRSSAFSPAVAIPWVVATTMRLTATEACNRRQIR